jgi:hypothetical protein
MPSRTRPTARPGPPLLRAALALAIALAVVCPPAGRAEETPARPGRSRFAPIMKLEQRRLVLQGARRRMERARAYARLLRRHPELDALHRGHPELARRGVRARRPPDEGEGGPPPESGGLRGSARGAAIPMGARFALGTNVRANDRAEDATFTSVTQAEEMMAALGQDVLIAWNDGLGFESGAPVTGTQGWAYSTDGGQTFTDGGEPPTPANWAWASDPIVTVNEKTGDFWFCALVNYGTTQNGIGVVKANFVGNAVQWGTPTLVRLGSNLFIGFDKPWMVADSLSGRLYLSYTVFGASDTIVFQRSAPGGASWDLPQRLSADAEAGLVQGSRPVVGPDGEVYVVWNSIGSYAADFMRIRKSAAASQGSSFGALTLVDSLYAGYGSGAPGFNRPNSITFPAIAVDRSHGTHRGRVYVAWHESVDFYDEDLGNLTPRSEVEANNSFLTATSFTMGQTVRGALSLSTDVDWFKFTGNAGQTVILFADSANAALDLDLRLVCTDGTTQLAFSALGAGGHDLVVFTLPAAGTYYMRCRAYTASTGGYRIQTGFDVPTPGERSRDHRDAFVTWSDGGASWATPVRASDSPAGYDDWLPEVSVAGDDVDPRVGSGKAYCLWYDWRDAPAGTCGGVSNVYLSRSDDGGLSWTRVGAVTDVATAWSATGADLYPNQGDYLSLFTTDSKLYAAWADGRNGDSDVYTVNVSLLTTPVDVALVAVQAEPDRVTVTWNVAGASVLTATVERRDASSDFTAVGQVSADGNGDLTYVDTAVVPGGRYAYRLLWDDGGTQRTTSEVWVDVPAAATFALHGAQPNPAVNGVIVSFALPDASPATLELLDVAGRRVSEKRVAGAGAQLVNLSEGLALEPGVYVVRLTRGVRSLTARVTVVR